MIFVSVGTEAFAFDRLIRAMDEVVAHVDGEPVVMQVGRSTYRPQRCPWVPFLPYEELVTHIARARMVVCHAGVGSILLCVQHGKVPVVVPRQKQFREHMDDHQVELAVRMAQLGLVVLVEDLSTLGETVARYEERVAAAQQLSSQRKAPRLADALAQCLA